MKDLVMLLMAVELKQRKGTSRKEGAQPVSHRAGNFIIVAFLLLAAIVGASYLLGDMADKISSSSSLPMSNTQPAAPPQPQPSVDSNLLTKPLPPSAAVNSKIAKERLRPAANVIVSPRVVDKQRVARMPLPAHKDAVTLAPGQPTNATKYSSHTEKKSQQQQRPAQPKTVRTKRHEIFSIGKIPKP
ncbi:MAG TPA: hypothetical protein VL307_10145 [Chitinophagaceae bacterium]|nr:hypothetical protein [Chitinophagaceae bacterium]